MGWDLCGISRIISRKAISTIHKETLMRIEFIKDLKIALLHYNPQSVARGILESIGLNVFKSTGFRTIPMPDLEYKDILAGLGDSRDKLVQYLKDHEYDIFIGENDFGDLFDVYVAVFGEDPKY